MARGVLIQGKYDNLPDLFFRLLLAHHRLKMNNQQITFQRRRSDGAVGGVVVLPLDAARELWRGMGGVGTLWNDHGPISVNERIWQAACQLSAELFDKAAKFQQ